MCRFLYLTTSLCLLVGSLFAADEVESDIPAVNTAGADNLSTYDSLDNAANLPDDMNATDTEIRYNSFPSLTHQYSLILRRTQGRSLGVETSYTTLQTLFFPFENENRWPFLDVRVHLLDNRNYAMNFGGGVRIENASNRVFGVNAYYDYSKRYGVGFSRLGLGAEYFGEIWGLRLNGYLPVGKKTHLHKTCFSDCYIGNYFFLQETFVDNLAGCNFEVEARLGNYKQGDFRVAIGPYYFHRKRGCQKNIVGGECRITADFGDYVTLAIQTSYDAVFKSRVQAQLSLNIPFYAEPSGQGIYLGNQNIRLFRPVERYEMNILKKRNRWTWNWE